MSEDDIANELRELELARLQALIDADTGFLEEIYSDDYHLITPAGTEMDRADLLDSVETGSLNVEEYRPISQVRIRFLGDSALLSYKSTIHVIVDFTTTFEHNSLHTHIYEPGDDGWQLTWEQNTAVGGFPPE